MQHLNPWPLRVAVFLFVFGTARYVERDSFHRDDSTLQPIIEVSSVIAATCVAVAVSLYYRARLTLRVPQVLVLLTLTLALAFSLRSWDPWLSFTRGALLMMISISTMVLLRTYGLRRLLYCVLSGYLCLIVVGLIIGLAAPQDFPLLVHDSGEETIRARLHLFKIHPIALADDCAICLLMSVPFRGRRIRSYRLILLSCLLLTVTRASIVFGLPLYIAGELLFASHLRSGLRPATVLSALVFLPAVVAVGLLFAFSDWWLVEQIRTSVSHVVDATKDNVTLNGRTALWGTLIENLSGENFYGYGVNGARYYLRTVNLWAEHSHNSVLETIYTAGYMGAFLLVSGLIAALIGRISEWRAPEARLLAVTLGYVIAAGMMNASWYETSSLIAISIACSEPWEPGRFQNTRLAAPLRVPTMVPAGHGA